ncbi:TVP38/TMEM64 family protein [Candidatus Woesearchaeota archaeon]|nr:TVP38/TMEM64 family protein [Candidatus Woesearchaeota archaeon]
MKPATQKRKVKLFFDALIAAALIILIIYFVINFKQFFTNPQEIRATLESYGVWAPIIFLFIEAIQVVAAPIPGALVTIAGGFAFGLVFGSILSICGVLLGISILFFLGKKLGRPFVEIFVDEEKQSKYDRIIEKRGIWALMIAQFIPLLSNDAWWFVAGLTRMRYRQLFVVALIVTGIKAPTYAFVGNSLNELNVLPLALLLTLLLALSIFAFLYKSRITDYLESRNHKP